MRKVSKGEGEGLVERKNCLFINAVMITSRYMKVRWKDDAKLSLMILNGTAFGEKIEMIRIKISTNYNHFLLKSFVALLFSSLSSLTIIIVRMRRRRRRRRRRSRRSEEVAMVVDEAAVEEVEVAAVDEEAVARRWR